MEKIRDLLNTSQSDLKIREMKGKGVFIEGATEEFANDEEEVLGVMTKGQNNRVVAATGMNEGSSRSHSVFIIQVKQLNVEDGGMTNAKLVLVDLAGSETVKKTGAAGQQLEEAKTINKSLSALGQVINALTDEKIKHIPYRDRYVRPSLP